jgi:hypothetical protein
LGGVSARSETSPKSEAALDSTSAWGSLLKYLMVECWRAARLDHRWLTLRGERQGLNDRVLGGFKDVGNPEVGSSAGGFSFPFVGLLENTHLRVVTVGKPIVARPRRARERRRARVLPRAQHPASWVRAAVRGRRAPRRSARSSASSCSRPAGRSTTADRRQSRHPHGLALQPGRALCATAAYTVR